MLEFCKHPRIVMCHYVGDHGQIKTASACRECRDGNPTSNRFPQTGLIVPSDEWWLWYLRPAFTDPWPEWK